MKTYGNRDHDRFILEDTATCDTNTNPSRSDCPYVFT